MAQVLSIHGGVRVSITGSGGAGAELDIVGSVLEYAV